MAAEKAPVISLEAKLTEHWQQALETGTLMVENAERNLARIAMIYGGQLSFDALDDDIGSEAET